MDFIDLKSQYKQYKEEIDSEIADVLTSASFILGEKVTSLEDKLKLFVNSKHALGVSSGTDALILSMMALGISAGDEVITTPFTFIATAESIMLLGAKPVFVDIDPLTYNIDASLIEDAITSKTKAIMPVSLYGQCADFEKINEIASKYNLKVIEDGCQSFGARANEGRSCGLSDLGCTSFFPSKPFGCYGDGGMIFTNDDELYEIMKQIRVHGQNERYNHVRLGINGRLDSLQAAILLGKLPYFEGELKSREEKGEYYITHLSEAEGIVTPFVREGNRHVFAQFSIQVGNRDKLQEYLRGKDIPTAIHYPIPLHLQPVFKHLGFSEGDFKIAEAVSNKIISLPMHPFLEKDTQDHIIEEILKGVRLT